MIFFNYYIQINKSATICTPLDSYIKYFKVRLEQGEIYEKLV